MMTLKVKEKEYKVKFGYNNFCDSDLLDRTADAMGIVGELEGATTDTNSMAKVRKLFTLTRELLFEGFKKYNPVSSLDEVGNILDDYLDEDPENHGLVTIFGQIILELMGSGFFGDLLTKSSEAMTKLTKKVSKKKN